MLFYHIRHIINKQSEQENSGPLVDGDDDRGGDGVGIGADDGFE